MDTSCEDIIEKLYKNYEILSDAKEKITEVCFFFLSLMLIKASLHHHNN